MTASDDNVASVSYRMPTTANAIPPRSAWRPLAIAVLILGAVYGAIASVQHAFFLSSTAGELVRPRGGWAILKLAGMKVDFRTYWLFAMVSALIALALLIGAILSFFRIQFARYLVCGGLCWIALWALLNLLNLVGIPQAAANTQRIEAAVSIAALAVIGCVTLTRRNI